MDTLVGIIGTVVGLYGIIQIGIILDKIWYPEKVKAKVSSNYNWWQLCVSGSVMFAWILFVFWLIEQII